MKITYLLYVLKITKLFLKSVAKTDVKNSDLDGNLEGKIESCWQKLTKIWFSSTIGTLSKSVPEQRESTWKVSFIFVTSRHTKTQSCHLLHCLYPLCHNVNQTKSWFLSLVFKKEEAYIPLNPVGGLSSSKFKANIFIWVTFELYSKAIDWWKAIKWLNQ